MGGMDGGGAAPDASGNEPDAAATDTAGAPDAASADTVVTTPVDGMASDAPGGPLLKNWRFDSDASFWTPELSAAQSWDATHDADSSSASGAISVTNLTVADFDGMTMSGSRQCLATAAAAHSLSTSVFIPTGTAGGSGGVNIAYFATTDCTGPPSGVFTSALVGTTNTWKSVTAITWTPAGAHSMAVRLVALKPFKNTPFAVLFDNVRLELQ